MTGQDDLHRDMAGLVVPRAGFFQATGGLWDPFRLVDPSGEVVEPGNRRVARSLEARWEARLAALAEAEQALDVARESLPPLPSRADLEKLAADLPGLWHSSATSSKDRKRLLRTLIADVTLLP